MANQREVEAGDLLAKMPEEDKAKRKARLAAVLDRGFTSYRLDTSYLDKNLSGQWARNEATEIARMHALGFEPYKGEIPENAPLKKEADGTIRVGDTILMVTSRENKALLDEIMAERIDARHNPKKPQIEEKNFTSSVDYGVQAINDSRVEEADASHIMSATKQE